MRIKDVGFWPLADMASAIADVRSRGQSRHRPVGKELNGGVVLEEI
jgi:hypothetical protein